MKFIIEIPTTIYKKIRFYGKPLNPRDVKELEKALTQAEVCKTGKWLRLNDDKSVLCCSACGKWACLSNYINEGEKDGQFKSPYCPYCGVKMEE